MTGIEIMIVIIPQMRLCMKLDFGIFRTTQRPSRSEDNPFADDQIVVKKETERMPTESPPSGVISFRNEIADSENHGDNRESMSSDGTIINRITFTMTTTNVGMDNNI